MFKIEKNIPLPTGTQDTEKYPFNQMEIGDSFIASTGFNSFEHMADEVDERNEAGDGRLFIHMVTCDDESGLNMLRVWRIEPRAYLDRNPVEAKILWFIQTLINDNGPQTRSKITQKDLGADGTGSRKHRLRVLDKYAFLFKKSGAKCGGVQYENA